MYAICRDWKPASALTTWSSSYLPWRVASKRARRKSMLYSSILETIGNTPLVELKSFSPRAGVQMYAKLDGANPRVSDKDRIAKKIIGEAEVSGKLPHEYILLEP